LFNLKLINTVKLTWIGEKRWSRLSKWLFGHDVRRGK